MLVSTMPLPTVVATLSWKMKRATQLKVAASSTAWCGFSTRVDTTVAIEFAASWKPFMKSKARATMMSPTRTVRLMAGIPPSINGGSPARSERLPGLRGGAPGAGSRVLQHDAFDDVRHVLAAVGDHLEEVVDRAELQDLLEVVLLAEELGEGRAH